MLNNNTNLPNENDVSNFLDNHLFNEETINNWYKKRKQLKTNEDESSNKNIPRKFDGELLPEYEKKIEIFKLSNQLKKYYKKRPSLINKHKYTKAMITMDLETLKQQLDKLSNMNSSDNKLCELNKLQTRLQVIYQGMKKLKLDKQVSWEFSSKLFGSVAKQNEVLNSYRQLESKINQEILNTNTMANVLI